MTKAWPGVTKYCRSCGATFSHGGKHICIQDEGQPIPPVPPDLREELAELRARVKALEAGMDEFSERIGYGGA